MTANSLILSDRDLLEKAAKAVGLKPSGLWFHDGMECEGPNATDTEGDFFMWNPLRNDAQAFRMAVQLQAFTAKYDQLRHHLAVVSADGYREPREVMRRAVVRVAAFAT